LIGLIVGGVLETAEIEALVATHKDDIRKQAKQNATIDDISKNLHTHLSSAGVKVNTFTVEDIYEANTQGDRNAQVWFNAEQIDDNTLSKIKEVSFPVFVGAAKYDNRGLQVRGFRLKHAYRQGGTQKMSSAKQPVTLNQVCNLFFLASAEVTRIFHV